jgi:hypothetical protein
MIMLAELRFGAATLGQSQKAGKAAPPTGNDPCRTDFDDSIRQAVQSTFN